MRLFVSFAAMLAVFASSGCFRTVYRAEDLAPLTTLNRAEKGEHLVAHFEESAWNHYFLFGLVPTSEPDLNRMIGRHVQPGREVRNLKIQHEVTFINAVVWALVGGIYNPMTTTVTGDVVENGS